MPSRPASLQPAKPTAVRTVRPADDRPTASSRGYGSRWQRTREGFLKKHPLCAACTEDGRTTEAAVVDHVIPHRGDWALFWDRDNWQPLCKRCHDQKTRRGE